MTDYTLPPLPEHSGWNNEIGKPYWFAVSVLQHGKQCAEAARAPLLARIAELNGQVERQAAVLRQQRERIAELEGYAATAKMLAKERVRGRKKENGDA